VLVCVFSRIATSERKKIRIIKQVPVPLSPVCIIYHSECVSPFFFKKYILTCVQHTCYKAANQTAATHTTFVVVLLFFKFNDARIYTPGKQLRGLFFSCLCVHGRLSLAICHISLFFFFFLFSGRAMNQPVFILLCFRESHVIKELVSCVFLSLFCYFCIFHFSPRRGERNPQMCRRAVSFASPLLGVESFLSQ
jgi:hypothetical protein